MQGRPVPLWILYAPPTGSRRPCTSRTRICCLNCSSERRDVVMGHLGGTRRARVINRGRRSHGGTGRVKPDATGSGAKGAPTREPAGGRYTLHPPAPEEVRYFASPATT